MAFWKSEYISDYVSTLQPNGKKRLVYQGDFFEFPGEKQVWRRHRLLLLAFALISMLLCIGIAVIDPFSMGIDGAAYVLLPYVGFLIITFLVFTRSVYLQFLPQRLERMDYEKCIVGLQQYTAISSFLALVTAVAQLIFILLTQTFSAAEWITVLCALAAAGMNLYSYRRQKAHPCKNIGKANTQG